MNPHHEIDEVLRDLAIEHVLAGAAPREDDDYAAHLTACAPCRAEVEAVRAEVDALGFLAPERSPRRDLLSRLVGSQPWKGWPDEVPAESTFVARDEAGWESTAHAGVFARKLFVDRGRDRVTMLVRMEPGSSYPGHVHGGPEECYVISGDLNVGTLTMTAGDFQRSEGGSSHPVQSTKRGCLLLITSSLHDRLHED